MVAPQKFPQNTSVYIRPYTFMCVHFNYRCVAVGVCEVMDTFYLRAKPLAINNFFPLVTPLTVTMELQMLKNGR